MIKILRFLIAGLPAFGVAFVLNYLLVKKLEMGTASAYALVLVVQIVINFFACRYFVFDVCPRQNLWKSFLVFFNGIVIFRIFDWAVYTLLTGWFGIPFWAAQLFNVVLFAVLKFEFTRRIFERKTSVASSGPIGPVE